VVTASTLPKTTRPQTRDAAAQAVRSGAGERPHQSTRELEAVFAERGDRMPTAGLALGLAISAGLWTLIAAIVF